MPDIHPTAVVAEGAVIAEDVEIGPHCVVEPDVEIGPGCRLREHVVIRRYTTLGSGNLVDAGCVFGGEPQDVKFDPATVSYLRVGDNNLFREYVTLSRATGAGHATVIGSNIFMMAYCHAGHEAVVKDGAILVNGAAVGGHAELGRRAYLSAHVTVHQYCWIGEGAMTQGNSGFSTHLPPYCLGADINKVAGLNVVGLRRAPGISEADRRQVKEAYALLYRRGLTPADALAQMDAHDDWGPPESQFRDFVRRVIEAEPPYKRPMAVPRARGR